jgi:hypothetical protein
MMVCGLASSDMHAAGRQLQRQPPLGRRSQQHAHTRFHLQSDGAYLALTQQAALAPVVLPSYLPQPVHLAFETQTIAFQVCVFVCVCVCVFVCVCALNCA